MGPDAAADAVRYGRIPPRAGAGQARDRQGEARGSGGNRAGEAGDRTGVAGGTSRYRTRATGALQPAERAASADRKTQEGNSETAAQPNAGEPEADGAATARDARRVDADLVGFEHRVGADAPSAQPRTEDNLIRTGLRCRFVAGRSQQDPVSPALLGGIEPC